MAVRASLAPGCFVVYRGSPGVGRVLEVEEDRVLVEFFESPAMPCALREWHLKADVRREALGVQSRVFVQDDGGEWRAGRVVGGGPPLYAVRFPNSEYDAPISEARLRVRWEKPPSDPLEVLLAGGQESPYFRDARLPVRELLVAQRAACSSTSGIISSGVQIHAHQVDAALRILRDPVRRYLLADEVGMGKSVQAGFVIRQVLIDDPAARVVLIVPAALVGQWQSELADKFFVDDFPGLTSGQRVTVTSHEYPADWCGAVGADLVVVDEAHLLASVEDPTDSRYKVLASVCHSAEQLLLISATPATQRDATHLALLHLLDPTLYRWDCLSEFSMRLEARRELGFAMYALDPEPQIPELLDLQLTEIARLLPEDARFTSLRSDLVGCFDGESLRSTVSAAELRRSVSALRAHVAETYRLHHRVIRHRRHRVLNQALDDEGIRAPFEVTGRTRPRLLALKSDEYQASVEALAAWTMGVVRAVQDEGASAALFAPVLGTYLSRLGGPSSDLNSLMQFRIDRGATTPVGVTPKEADWLRGPELLSHELDVLRTLGSGADRDGCSELAQSLVARVQLGQRAVAFTGRGTLARALLASLAGLEGGVRIGLGHTEGMDARDLEHNLDQWKTAGGLLVVDQTGDIGRNFQDAHIAFHVRLPADPNELEQRIGRVDRYGAGSAAAQFVVSGDDGLSLHRLWLGLLVDGFGVFDRSISALQNVVGREMDEVWASVLTLGSDAFLTNIPTAREALAGELRRVNEMDELEASFEQSGSGLNVSTDLQRLDLGWKGVESAFRELLEGSGGFRFHARKRMDGSVTFERGQVNPLLSPRLMRKVDVPELSRTGLFDRWSLRDRPRRRLFRIGNPLVDGVNSVLDLDDRGQACAVWRVDQRWDRDPLAYFGFDFLVEGDTTEAEELYRESPARSVTLRRRADAALPPFMRRVWIPSNAEQALTDSDSIAFLERPYAKDRGDTNLNASRIEVLHDLFGGRSSFDESARACAVLGRLELERITDFRRTCEAAERSALEDAAVLQAQSLARTRAGGFVGDPEALQEEQRLDLAIAAGLADPVVRLLSVVCAVRAKQSWRAHVS